MRVTLNGEARELPEGASLAELLAGNGIDLSSSAVAVNAVVVPRSRVAEIRLSEGDRVEVIGAVGGG